MKLDRIPARMLFVLGLAPGCGPQAGDGDTGGTADGSSTQGPGSTGGMTATSSSTSSNPDSGDIDVGTCLSEDIGPCLGQPLPETTGTGDDTGATMGTLGPCLDIEPTTGTGSGSGSGTDSGGTTEVGPCLAPPPDEPASPMPASVVSPRASADDVLDRVLSSGRLPHDVAARLKRRE